MPPRSRTKRNSQYTVQVEVVDEKQYRNAIPEAGGLIEYNDAFYIGDGVQWLQFAPINSTALQIGFGRYDDTEYNSSNPYIMSAENTFVLPNNAGEVFNPNYISFYDENQNFILENGCTYALTIAFKSFLNTNNGHAELSFYCPTDNDYSNIADIVMYPKGNGMEHIFSKSFNFYANENVENDGLQIKFTASHSGAIYDVIYFIEKLSHA